jgi:hypothetical protein
MFWIWRTYWLEGIGKLFSSKTRLFTLFFFFEARLFTLFVHHILGKNILSSILYFFYLNLPHFQCNLYTISKGLFGYAFATHECAFWGLDHSFLSFTIYCLSSLFIYWSSLTIFSSPNFLPCNCGNKYQIG